jgi:hypothetical protein
LLSSIFLKGNVRLEGRAVARIVGGGPACVLALSDTAARAVEVTGNTEVILDGCSVAANSVDDEAYYMPNSTAVLKADCVSTVGRSAVKEPDPTRLVLNPTVCTSVQEQAPKTLDPYAAVPEPVLTTTSLGNPDPTVKVDLVVDPRKKLEGPIDPGSDNFMWFTGDLDLGTVTFTKPALIVIDGGTLKMNGGTITGDGITFFFANNATADFGGNPEIDLTAPSPTTGVKLLEPYVGLLFFGARCSAVTNPLSCTEEFKMAGGPNSTMKGAIYLPGSKLSILGNSLTESSCLQLIADRLTFQGSSVVKMGTACAGVGTKNAMVGQLVQLVE